MKSAPTARPVASADSLPHRSSEVTRAADPRRGDEIDYLRKLVCQNSITESIVAEVKESFGRYSDTFNSNHQRCSNGDRLFRTLGGVEEVTTLGEKVVLKYFPVEDLNKLISLMDPHSDSARIEAFCGALEDGRDDVMKALTEGLEPEKVDKIIDAALHPKEILHSRDTFASRSISIRIAAEKGNQKALQTLIEIGGDDRVKKGLEYAANYQIYITDYKDDGEGPSPKAKALLIALSSPSPSAEGPRAAGLGAAFGKGGSASSERS